MHSLGTQLCSRVQLGGEHTLAKASHQQALQSSSAHSHRVLLQLGLGVQHTLLRSEQRTDVDNGALVAAEVAREHGEPLEQHELLALQVRRPRRAHRGREAHLHAKLKSVSARVSELQMLQHRNSSTCYMQLLACSRS
jgi:hypothetical protein